MLLTAKLRAELRVWNREIRVARETYWLEQLHQVTNVRVRATCRVKGCGSETRSQIGICRACQREHQIATQTT